MKKRYSTPHTTAYALAASQIIAASGYDKSDFNEAENDNVDVGEGTMDPGFAL